MKPLSLSPTQQREVQELRQEVRECELYSGVGVIYESGLFIAAWGPAVKQHLSSLNYKIINDLPARIESVTFFATIAQSIAPHKPHASPAVAELSDSPPFVIAVFVSGLIDLQSPYQLLYTSRKKVNIVDDIIHPFLPQSAPHLQHIPKLFFITAAWQLVYLHAPPPQLPENPSGNYCVVYHVTGRERLTRKWAERITSDLFVHGMTVQGAIEKSRSHLNKDEEGLYYFTCLKQNLVLKK